MGLFDEQSGTNRKKDDQEIDRIPIFLDDFILVYNYHFYDRLLPVAIKNQAISAKELIDLWVFVQRYGNDKFLLWDVIVEADDNLSHKICCNSKVSYTDDDVIRLLQSPINYMKGEDVIKDLKEYRNIDEEEEPEDERKLIIDCQDELYQKFVPSIDTAQLKNMWEDAERGNHLLQMCYYYFLNKYITQYAKTAILKQNDWPKMVELKENVLSQSCDVLTNLELLRAIAPSMACDYSKVTISDIMGNLVQLMPTIRENKIL